ncbi:regulatory protein, tetR family [Saccharopolyspora antimicrobica]|uniref:Regulatory protein, tetR family n=1 Tax=Saccharopolyspora antimicrobica TaxID=455193 RepID=A0A1I5EIU8_9PSEU|nr:TetR/AcrR family transcriptional regulator [Saccharopolyspora antimicrobica]RKT86837.1 TetR family transcriptional regulator [Saccharopolyspora antimicrobica]SFO11452.1 regulatory protein, tetR family [Saccharopolyspora antimicrobica]
MAQGGVADPDRGIELLWRDGGSRTGLSLDRIVGAAVEVADAEGLAGLSMRKVAERLGFTSMSLYRHVPGRDQLVELMRDAVLAELGSPPAEGGWRPRLEACARESWELCKRHPWLAGTSGSRSLPGPNAVAHYERLLGILAGTGLAPSEVIASVDLVDRFVNAEAVALAEVARVERSSGMSHEEWWGARGSLFDRLDRFPVITALWEAGGYDEPLDSFEFGLARVLDGIELLVQSRDEKRDETCRMCGGPVEQASAGRPRAYCSRACQQRAYRQRKSG